MAALLMLSCSQKEATFTVKGTITDSLATTPGAMIVINDMLTGQKDTVQIVNGTFEYTGVASDSTVKRAGLVINARIRHNLYTQFIPQEGVIEVSLDEPAKAVGTPLNDALVEYNEKMNSIYDEYYKKRDELSKSLSPEELQKAMKEAREAIMAQVSTLSQETYLANSNNAVGFVAFTNMVYDFKTLAEFDEWMNKGANFIKNYKQFVGLRKSIEGKENTAEGKMFADFSGKTPDGKDIKLSDYVGKGKYVLVDFWASWCGPCKAEIPVIKEVYDKYSKKGLVVLGVAVWDGDNSKSKETMKELDMKWDQIFVGEDKTATDIYGVNGIPHIILFAPDGTIAKRGLRGDVLKATVADAMKK